MISLYIHIPFCESKCYYCDFCSGIYDDCIVKQYITALTQEIAKFKTCETVGSIFIGGGTPSSISPIYIERIMNVITANYFVLPTAEITIECNPNSATLNKLLAYKNLGINRVSVGVQSTNDDILKEIGRSHTRDDFYQTADKVAKLFTNYNFDIMVGLPSQGYAEIVQTLRDVLKFSPTHISAYSLILEPETALARMVQTAQLKLPSEERTIAQYDLVRQVLGNNQLNRYEISNFAKDGYECIHNLNYWNRGEYLGFGLSAHSHIDNIRYANTTSMKEYLNGTTQTFEEHLDARAQKEEMIMLSLRLEKGIDLKKYKQQFNSDLLIEKKDSINNLLKQNLILVNDGYLKIAPNAFYVSNSIICQLI